MSEIIEKVDPITITDSAAENILKMLQEKKLTDHCLRVYVAGIGCSGPQYGLALDQNPRENDTVLHAEGFQVLVDPNSLAFLEGATIDFVETPQGAGFKIDNPNPAAASACGSCSESCG